MSKKNHLYFCTECGNESAQWAGQCHSCGEWNTLKEAPKSSVKKSTNSPSNQLKNWGTKSKPIELNKVPDLKQHRIHTFMSEFDRVLGGGVVKGSVVLIGGDPGVGKSTLLGQIMTNLSKQYQVLYVSGEESQQQIAQRCRRLHLNENRLLIYCETEINDILNTMDETKANVVVIDSIQTIHNMEVKSAAGSVTQVRDCCAALVQYSKQNECATFVIGHVTKDGSIAGPRILEHMVDTVLYFEGENSSRFRLLRAFKNRFGSVNELAVFAMLEEGLKQISNPSAMFLANRSNDQPGNIIIPVKEGSRSLLLEVQALTVTHSGGLGKRLSVGFDPNRLSLLLAVLSRHTGLQCHGLDIYINVTGGMKINETAADLAVILAILSSIKNSILSSKMICFGEVGLNGEIRPVIGGEYRLSESQKQGFDSAIIPINNQPPKNSAIVKSDHFNIYGVKNLKQAIEFAGLA